MNLDTTSKDYIVDLYDQGLREKGVAALEFFFFAEYGIYKTGREWAKHWNVSKSTTCRWCKDFKAEEQRQQQASITHFKG